MYENLILNYSEHSAEVKHVTYKQIIKFNSNNSKV